jgi:hypothetical protein
VSMVLALKLRPYTPLVTYSAAAEMLGVHRRTVADMVKKLGIVPKRMPLSGPAKGLDRADLRVLRHRLRASGCRRVPVAGHP